MLIQNSVNIPANYKMHPQMSFAGNKRGVSDSVGKFLYANVSAYMRSDLNWEKFTKYLIKKYKDVEKPNIFCLACSEGAEPFSVAMKLIDKLGEINASKFFPIKASDFDEAILDYPKKGKAFLTTTEIKQIKEQCKNFDKFIKLGKNERFDTLFETNGTRGTITPLLAKSVVFKTSDLRTEIENINPDNNIVLCRNVWPYIPKKEHPELAQKLYNQLGENSMLVVGRFDHTSLNLYHDLTAAGFKPVEGFTTSKYDTPLVFLKPSAQKKPDSTMLNSVKTFFQSFFKA